MNTLCQSWRQPPFEFPGIFLMEKQGSWIWSAASSNLSFYAVREQHHLDDLRTPEQMSSLAYSWLLSSQSRRALSCSSWFFAMLYMYQKMLSSSSVCCFLVVWCSFKFFLLLSLWRCYSGSWYRLHSWLLPRILYSNISAFSFLSLIHFVVFAARCNNSS